LAGLLKVAGMAKSTFHYQIKTASEPDKYAELKQGIKTIYTVNKGRYGYRRIAATLWQMGQTVSRNTVQRLMGVLSIKSLVRPKKYKSYKGDVGRVAPNILKRKFEADKFNKKWLTDVTEFKIGQVKVFLSPVMDLFNREIVAYTMSDRPCFKMVDDMLDKAIATLQPDEKPMLHSDQGWQYQMSKYQKTLEKRGMAQSMSRKGNCHDNAAMESFFGVLKTELFYLEKFASVDQLKRAIAKYIHYYNHDRIKMKLGGLSPVQYRLQTAAS
jgi:putative transposase